jgi:uncharacterized protein (UPF0333 family)
MKGLRALFNKRGQSATEYILILAVLVAIIVVVAKVMPGKFKALVESATVKVSTGIDKAASSGDQ